MSRNQDIPPAQLFLVTPQVSDGVVFADEIATVLDAGVAASVLLRLSVADDATAKQIVKTLAPIVQKRGAALLVEGWSTIVARAGADGIHCIDQKSGLREALESFKPERIVGVGGVRSKHDAMMLAESGADYVMIGEPGRDGRIPPLDSVIERTGWWAELFEVPCVAFAPDLASIPLLAEAGADFVAVGDAVFAHDKGAVEGMKLASRLLQQVRG